MPSAWFTGIRKGRTVVYSLYDNHVAMLLDEAVYHIEHLGRGITDVINDDRRSPPDANNDRN